MLYSRGKVLALLLMTAAGCSTVPRADAPPDDALMPEPAVVILEPEPVPVPTPVPTPAPVPMPVPSPPANPFSFSPGETWIPLDRWSQSTGLGMVQRLPANPTPAYSFTASNGTMAFRIGSQLAYWNGSAYHLGFAPQLIDGHPFIHVLDVQKNLEPLLDWPAPPRPRRVIVIDPGHGGIDSGATNIITGHFEKEYTLDLARRLESALATNGWTVLLTRTTDVKLTLSNRVAFADLHQADLFLSLHFNTAFPDRKPAGLETYCLTPSGMPSTLTRGFADNASLVYPNNGFDTENLELAIRVHRALLSANGFIDRGVSRARFLTVLQGQRRPAILVEGGYLSNPAEARQIADPAWRQRFAEALAQALAEDGATHPNAVTQSTAPPVTTPGGRLN